MNTLNSARQNRKILTSPHQHDSASVSVMCHKFNKPKYYIVKRWRSSLCYATITSLYNISIHYTFLHKFGLVQQRVYRSLEYLRPTLTMP